MTDHHERMLRRLPPIYRGGELVAATLTPPALHAEIADQELDWIQRERWFDTAADLDDAARLAALLDIAPEPWQDLGEYRPWVHDLRTALLERGAVTGAAIRGFVADYTAAHAATTGVECVRPITAWSARRDPAQAALIEQPPVRRWATVPDAAGTRPLTRFVIANRGGDPVAPAFLLTGRGAGPERCPVIASLTTGRGVVFLGELPVGSRLAIVRDARDAGGAARALLDGADVTERLFGLDEVVPGRAWRRSDLRPRPPMLLLERGDNELWYLPVAHFDQAALDGPMLALPGLEVRDGIWDETAFDAALFEQVPRARLRVTWVEQVPAAFRVELPAAIMRSPAGDVDDALVSRGHLGAALSAAIDRLRPAGVEGACELRPFAELQPAHDRLRIVQPLRLREAGSVGADALADHTGAFEEAPFDGSNFG